jgi:8-amino-7-oxononanoate synthase
LERSGLLRTLEPLDSPQGVTVRVRGNELVNFSSNDYLGLAAHPRLAEAWAEAACQGVGSGASRLVVGESAAHRALEERLARFESAEAALLFNSGYAANLGILSTLVGAEDAVFSDALNHASIVDGCRLSRARVCVYPHRDVEALSRALAQTSARRKVVVTDSVFSMDGDLAPLEELVLLCERNGAALVVDEAHATGVLGEKGTGLCEALGLADRVDVRMGTLGKALGVFGAFACTSAPVRRWLLQRARPLVFSTSLPPALCEAAQAAVDLVEREPDRRDRLWSNIRYFTSGLERLGFAAGGASPIFPVVLGGADRAVAASAYLRQRGLLVKAIRPPTVPEGSSRLRFALCSEHSRAQLDLALTALGEGARDGIFLAA